MMSLHKRHRSSISKDNATSSDEEVNKSSNYLITQSLRSSMIMFTLFLVARLASATWNNINDCDETYNYWEPAHFLLYGQGFQTWEYSPTYAIRSYFYLWFYIVPAKLLLLLGFNNKIAIFYLTRCYMSIVCALCETFLYRSVIKTFDAKVGRYYGLLSILSAGMFSASSAFLPSSFGLYLTCLIIGSWLRHKYRVFIFVTALNAIVGWPFTAAISIPMALDLFFVKRRPVLFIVWSCISAVAILICTVGVDWYYYGKPVCASLNILLYNVFSSHGPNLYGTEPLTYYINNLFLNLNLVFVLALVALPLLMISLIVNRSKRESISLANTILCMLSLYLWLAIFFSQPHKEERFMYPVYPLFALTAAIALVHLEFIVLQLTPKLRSLLNLGIEIIFLVIFVLSLSRILALYNGYGGSLSIYHRLNELSAQLQSTTQEKTTLCLGKEWHRFPSSFLVPSHFRVEFVPSEFRGQLPKHYDSSHPYPTRIIPGEMNDANREELSRYVSPAQCHLMIDSDYELAVGRDLPYSRDPKNWLMLHSTPFLDANRCSALFRAFYVPHFTHNRCHYVGFNLLKNANLD